MRVTFALRGLLLLLLLLSCQTLITAQTAKPSTGGRDPFLLDKPSGWGSERINFPLDFAPSIKFQGFEELRFAPGFSKPTTEGYFSYFFVWLIEGQPEITAPQLESALTDYFRGLTEGVGKAKGDHYDLSTINSKVTKESDGQYRAEVNTFDPFATKQPIKLNFKISVQRSSQFNRTGVLFEVSPKPADAPIWQQLQAIAGSFKFQSDREQQ